MSARSKARKRALDILFESELRGRDPLETLADHAAVAGPPVREYTRELVEGAVAHAGEIDDRITAALARGWTLQRMPRVDRNTVRLAVLEIDYLDVPDSVAVAEAMALVRDLSTDDSPAFVNGLLGRIIATKPTPTPDSAN
ncbi:MAG TPA: transcription antitermination factor NusB [Microlunatus sp.]|nr:transcription antitermination factor NusB [Microlunatus sp.]